MASGNRGIKHKLFGVFASRWLTTVILIVIFDVITFLAFAKTGGSSGFAHQDKVLHALAFAVLTVLGHLCLHFDVFRKRRRLSWFLLFFNAVIWSGYGLAIELGQKMLQYRQASMGDFIADVVGIAFGTFLILVLRLYPKQKVEKHGSK